MQFEDSNADVIRRFEQVDEALNQIEKNIDETVKTTGENFESNA